MPNFALKSLVLVAALSLAAGCSSADKDRRGARKDLSKMAIAQATSQDGDVELKAFMKQKDDGVKVKLVAKGLKPGAVHGVHIHENGSCIGPDYTSAGAHFDPEGTGTHGAPDSDDAHLGDLGNLTADSDGKAKKIIEVKGATLTEGSTNFVGRALILHVGEDDLTSQPTGDSGARLICAEIRTPEKGELKAWKKDHRKDGKKDWKREGKKSESEQRSGTPQESEQSPATN